MRDTVSKILLAASFVSAFLAVPVFSAMTAQANLITNGDFNGAPVQDSNFSTSSGPYDTWLGQSSSLQVVNDGLGIGGNNDYLRHLQNTVRLFQVVRAGPAIAPAGTGMELSFDYIYQNGFTGLDQSSVRVLGLTSGDTINRFLFPGDGFPSGDVIFQDALSSSQLVWTSYAGSFPVPETYDAVALVFTAGAFGETVEGVRGLDNVDLHPVPEPSVFLLVGAGVLGAGFLIRKVRPGI